MADPAKPTDTQAPSEEPSATADAAVPVAGNGQNIWHRIKEHRVVQWTLAYAAVAYTLLHATEMISEALEWPHLIARVLTLVLLVGAPFVMALSWYHGVKSSKKVSAPELTIIVILLLNAGIILWLFSGTPAERTSERTVLPLAPTPHTTPESQAAAKAPAVGSTTSTNKPRIAVLPFENLSQDPNNAFFADGLHEEVLTALANGVPGLEVISRTTMNTYKNKPVPVEQLAKELNCTYVLEGSVRREGDEVRLTVQLIDARNDSHVWAENYDRKLVKAMTLETEVAGAVASRLSIKVGRTVTQPTVATNALAYDLYLKARASEDSGGAPHGDPEALLKQAIALDPAFVRAYTELIGYRVGQFLSNEDPAEAKLTLARRDLEKVRMLAPEDPVAIAAQAIVAFADMDYVHALELFTAAERADLSDPRLLDWKSQLLFAMGRYQEATELTRRLAELDPKNEVAQARWQFMLMELHQGREALQVADLGLVRDPGSFQWQSSRANVLFELSGDLEPSKKILDPAIAQLQRSPSNTADAVAYLLYQINLEHRYAEGRRLIDTVSADTWNQQNWDWPLTRVGRTPVADMRGWQDLLLGDAAEAKRDGERIFKFLRAEPETKWNRWFHALLRADAQLFTGDKGAAIRTANDAVATTRAAPDVSDQSNAYVWATQVMAWAGAGDDAAARLESLSTAIPGLWPGEIAYNPLWTVPLAQSGRYSQLRDHLIAQLRTTKLE